MRCLDLLANFLKHERDNVPFSTAHGSVSPPSPVMRQDPERIEFKMRRDDCKGVCVLRLAGFVDVTNENDVEKMDVMDIGTGYYLLRKGIPVISRSD